MSRLNAKPSRFVHAPQQPIDFDEFVSRLIGFKGFSHDLSAHGILPSRQSHQKKCVALFFFSLLAIPESQHDASWPNVSKNWIGNFVLNYGAIISIETIAREVINQQPVIHFNAFSFKREAIKTNEMKLMLRPASVCRVRRARSLSWLSLYLFGNRPIRQVLKCVLPPLIDAIIAARS